MGKTLAHVIVATEAHRRNASQHELDPANDGHELAHPSVRLDDHLPDLAMNAPLQVELQVDAHDDLGKEGEHEGRHKLGVGLGCELAAFVFVAQEVADEGEQRARRLDGDVQSGADYAQDHAGGKEDAPSHRLHEYMDP